ncbi:MAG: ADP-ribosylglycohydrolase family protein, partial [bacterium]
DPIPRSGATAQKEDTLMWRPTHLAIIGSILLCLFCGSVAGEPPRSMPLERYLDQLKGGWAGQMIGVSYGAPYEFKAMGEILTDPIREWKPEYIENTIQQDDLYVEMTFLQAIEAKGLNTSTEEAGWFFRDSKYDLWHANKAARDNLRAGIPAPKSGHPKYNHHADDIDFQIESDIFGLLCPGMPLAAQEFCDRFGHIMNYGDGVYGGMFVTSMLAVAFFEDDIRTIVEAGYQAIPPDSKYGLLIRDILDYHKQNPEDWKGCWQLLETKWAQDDICGANKPFNIDAKLNGGYIAIGLLWGNGDWDRTLEITTRCGQDADCNPSNAAGILGVLCGYKKIPEKYTAGIPSIADKNFSYTNYNFNTLAETCAKYAKQIIEQNGGRIESRDGKETLLIPIQKPSPPKQLEQFTVETPANN